MQTCVVAHAVRSERDADRPGGAPVALSAHQEHQCAGDVCARVDLLRDAAARSRISRKSLAALEAQQCEGVLRRPCSILLLTDQRAVARVLYAS